MNLLRNIVVAATLLSLLIVQSPRLIADDRDEQTVEGFLNRLGLIDLQLLQLKRMVNRPGANAAKQKLARRLADLYAGQLMRSSEDAKRYARLEEEIKKLLASFPLARTDLLEVQLLRADFNRAAALVGKWFDDPKEASTLDDADQILLRILPLLLRFESSLGKNAEQLGTRLDNMEDGATKTKEQRELARIQAGVAQATFFAAWSSYYRGLVLFVAADAGKSKTMFEQSRTLFRKFLGISDGQQYSALEVGDMGLSAEPMARALIGLGQSEGALGNVSDCLACFKVLQHNSVNPAIQDEAPFRCAQGLLHVQRYADATRYAEEQINGFSKKPTQGKVSLCVALIQSAYANKQAKADTQLKRLGDLGINGLAKISQFGAIRKLSDKYGFVLDESQGFYPCLIKGQQRLAAAAKSKSPKDYQAASQLLEKALKFPESARDLAASGQCHFQLGWCYLNAKEFVKAGEHYEQAASKLKTAGDERAPESLWNAFVMYRRVMKKNPRYMSSAIEMLETLKRQFPNHPHAKRADYQIQRLQSAAGSSAAALKQLMKIQPTDPTYVAARYDVCMLLYRRWKAHGQEEKKLVDELQLAVDVVLAIAKAGDERKLKCALLVVESGLRSKPAKLPRASKYAALGTALAAKLPAKNPRVSEYHFWQLQLARASKNLDEAKTHASWLAKNASGSAYELPALIIMAKSLETAIKAAPQAERRNHLIEIEKVYARLVRHYRVSPAAVKSKKNAQVVLSKLAFYSAELGNHNRAATYLGYLLAAFPKNKTYLRRGGIALFKARKYPQAIGHWRTLVRGNRSGSAEWYEAKYHQLACLEKTNRATAVKAFKQFRLLNPKLGPPQWRNRFSQMGRRLQ